MSGTVGKNGEFPIRMTLHIPATDIHDEVPVVIAESAIRTAIRHFVPPQSSVRAIHQRPTVWLTDAGVIDAREPLVHPLQILDRIRTQPLIREPRREIVDLAIHCPIVFLRLCFWLHFQRTAKAVISGHDKGAADAHGLIPQEFVLIESIARIAHESHRKLRFARGRLVCDRDVTELRDDKSDLRIRHIPPHSELAQQFISGIQCASGIDQMDAAVFIKIPKIQHRRETPLFSREGFPRFLTFVFWQIFKFGKRIGEMTYVFTGNNDVVLGRNDFESIVFQISQLEAQLASGFAFTDKNLIGNVWRGHIDNGQFDPRHGFNRALNFGACGLNAGTGIQRQNDLGNSLASLHYFNRKSTVCD